MLVKQNLLQKLTQNLLIQSQVQDVVEEVQNVENP